MYTTMSELSIKKIVFSANTMDSDNASGYNDNLDTIDIHENTSRKMKRVDCWIDTKTICETNKYPCPNISVCETYNKEFVLPKSNTSSTILFHNMDTIDCAIMYDKPLVLNMSDDEYAGGWVNMGSGAQEESLFRRSNYHLTLTQDFYPISDNECIYSSNVSIVKSAEKDGWKLLDKPFTLDFVACPALKYPYVDDDNCLLEEDIELLETKIKMIIQVAVKYNHNTIVFGAMGCGAWQNPPREVAKIFRKVLMEYDGVIQRYVFAIYDSGNEEISNFEVFQEVFYL
jgi:uncharacterized protein (TIGR02452 family)